MDAKVTRENIIKEVKANLILDAARKVFTEKGFQNARMEDIGEAAGFSKASLYTYFADKEEIFLSLALHDSQTLIEEVRKIINYETSFRQNLEAMLKIILDFFKRNFATFLSSLNIHAICIIQQEQKLNEKHKALLSEIHKKMEEMLNLQLMLIKKGKEKKEIKSELSEEILLNYLGSLIRGMFFYWQISGKTGDVETETRNLLGFVSKGFDIG